jgi:ferrous iron transport protein B
VVQTVAVERTGIPALTASLKVARPSTFRPTYDAGIEAAIADLEPILPKDLGIATRAVALMVLAGDESLQARLRGRLGQAELELVDTIRRRAASRHPESLRFVISRQRLQAAERLHDQVVTRSGTSVASGIARKLGLWAVHPLLGVPMLLAALYACYQFVGVFGAGTLVDLLEDDIFYARVVPWTEAAIRFLAPPGRSPSSWGPPVCPSASTEASS